MMHASRSRGAFFLACRFTRQSAQVKLSAVGVLIVACSLFLPIPCRMQQCKTLLLIVAEGFWSANCQRPMVPEKLHSNFHGRFLTQVGRQKPSVKIRVKLLRRNWSLTISSQKPSAHMRMARVQDEARSCSQGSQVRKSHGKVRYR